MRKVYPLVTLLLIFVFSSLAFGREARLVRYPSYNNGRIAFTYDVRRDMEVAACRLVLEPGLDGPAAADSAQL